MSVFSSPIRSKPWLGQISILSLILGGLLALSLKTQDQIRTQKLPNMRPSTIVGAFEDLHDENDKLRRQVAETRAQLEKYRVAENGSEKIKLIADELRRVNAYAGLTALTGPGVIVTLRDSKNRNKKPAMLSDQDWLSLSEKYWIHDADIRDVINELRNAGAEAVAVNDQRVSDSTSIRCVGSVVQVNAVPTAGSPVRITAIGKPELLATAITMREGLADQYALGRDAAMIEVEKSEKLKLTAFTGSTTLRVAKIAGDAEAEQAQKNSEEAAKVGTQALMGSEKK